MPRRIEIELTSARQDGSWTWRAAGAREPKGVLDGGLLYDGAKAGDVVKAEAEFELEGIVITSVVAPKADSRSQAQTIEVVGPSRNDTPGVTTQLLGRGDRRDRRRDGDDDRRRDRGPGRTGDGRGRSDGGRSRREGAPAAGGPDRDRRRGGDDQHHPGSPERRGGATRDGAAGRRGDDQHRAGSPERRGDDQNRAGPPERRGGTPRDGRDGAGPRPGRPEGDRRPGTPSHTSSQAERARARRLNPGSAHRRSVMEALPPEQQPIAEQLLRGGIPAVRTALHLEREKAETEGRAAPNSDALLALAESLLPRLRAADWRDRAEAAAAAVDDISMRDLRSVVAGADLARDEESRALATKLRDAVDARVAKLHSDWTADITGQLDAGRVVRAVRLSSRPPDAGARLEPELAHRLAQAAGSTMAPDTSPDLWASILEAVAESPIRRSVTPAGLPENAPPDLKRAAHQYSGSIPALAKMLGVTIPPPPAPTRRRPQDRPGGARGPRGNPPGSRPGPISGTELPGPADAVGTPAPPTDVPGEAEAIEVPEGPEEEVGPEAVS